MKPTEQHKYSADLHKILLAAQIYSITVSDHSWEDVMLFGFKLLMSCFLVFGRGFGEDVVK